MKNIVYFVLRIVRIWVWMLKTIKLLAREVHVFDPRSGAWGARDLYSATTVYVFKRIPKSSLYKNNNNKRLLFI